MKKAFQNAANLVQWVIERSANIHWPKMEVLNLNHPGHAGQRIQNCCMWLTQCLRSNRS